jgi:hypothetical protein
MRMCLPAAAAELPLWGRRVLVTAPRQYAGRLAAPLAAAGARVLTLPCIAIRRLEAADQLQVPVSSAAKQSGLKAQKLSGQQGTGRHTTRCWSMHGSAALCAMCWWLPKQASTALACFVGSRGQ